MGKSLVLEFWDRSEFLTIKNKDYLDCAKKLINEQLKEDIGRGDITANSLIDKGKKIKAAVIAKQDGIIAGIEEAFLFGLNIKKIKADGSKVKKGDIIIEIYDDARKILASERTLLNIMQRMSGIATAAHNIKKITGNRCFISGTRKTLFSLMDKKALSVGGALTHRLNLEDSILIKDNHLQLLGNNIKKALKLADKSKTKYIEIEVKNEKEALGAAMAISDLKSKKLFAIMFDNMGASIIKNSITKISNRLNNYNEKIKIFSSTKKFQRNFLCPRKTRGFSQDIKSISYFLYNKKIKNNSINKNYNYKNHRNPTTLDYRPEFARPSGSGRISGMPKIENSFAKKITLDYTLSHPEFSIFVHKKIILFEASGGINEKNIQEYSKTGVDIISLGFLTHSAKAFDMSLEIL